MVESKTGECEKSETRLQRLEKDVQSYKEVGGKHELQSISPTQLITFAKCLTSYFQCKPLPDVFSMHKNIINPREGGRFIFSAEKRGKDELKDVWSIFHPFVR